MPRTHECHLFVKELPAPVSQQLHRDRFGLLKSYFLAANAIVRDSLPSMRLHLMLMIVLGAISLPACAQDEPDALNDIWEDQFSPRLQASDETLDFDGDGFTNLEESIWWTDPRDSSSHPTIEAKEAGGLIWVSHAPAPGKRFCIEESIDLEAWTDATGELTDPTGLGVAIPVAVVTGDYRFYRVRSLPDTDYDGDGLTTVEEVSLRTSDYLVDSDEDGVSDAAERAAGTDPASFPDADSDGLPDAWETGGTGGTSPSNPDSDGDCIPDGREITIQARTRRVLQDRWGYPDYDWWNFDRTLPSPERVAPNHPRRFYNTRNVGWTAVEGWQQTAPGQLPGSASAPEVGPGSWECNWVLQPPAAPVEICGAPQGIGAHSNTGGGSRPLIEEAALNSSKSDDGNGMVSTLTRVFGYNEPTKFGNWYGTQTIVRTLSGEVTNEVLSQAARTQLAATAFGTSEPGTTWNVPGAHQVLSSDLRTVSVREMEITPRAAPGFNKAVLACEVFVPTAPDGTTGPLEFQARSLSPRQPVVVPGTMPPDKWGRWDLVRVQNTTVTGARRLALDDSGKEALAASPDSNVSLTFQLSVLTTMPELAANLSFTAPGGGSPVSWNPTTRTAAAGFAVPAGGMSSQAEVALRLGGVTLWTASFQVVATNEIILHVSPTQAELMEPITFTAFFVDPSGTPCDGSIIIEVLGPGFSDWLEVGSSNNPNGAQNSSFTVPARMPGHFSARARNNTGSVSEIVEFDILYPTVAAIKADPNVVKETEAQMRRSHHLNRSAGACEKLELYGIVVVLTRDSRNTPHLPYFELKMRGQGSVAHGPITEIPTVHDAPFNTPPSEDVFLKGGHWGVARYHTHPPTTNGCLPQNQHYLQVDPPDPLLLERPKASPSYTDAYYDSDKGSNAPGLVHDYADRRVAEWRYSAPGVIERSNGKAIFDPRPLPLSFVLLDTVGNGLTWPGQPPGTDPTNVPERRALD